MSIPCVAGTFTFQAAAAILGARQRKRDFDGVSGIVTA
jgi:hypothetical protein